MPRTEAAATKSPQSAVPGTRAAEATYNTAATTYVATKTAHPGIRLTRLTAPAPIPRARNA
jgi:hypothetical protein